MRSLFPGSNSVPVISLTQRAFVLLIALSIGCGSDGGDSSVGPDAVSPAGVLVGSWTASILVLTNKANEQQSGDIVAQFGAVFTMDVQQSGRYLAILSAFGQSSSESGTLTVSGTLLTMRRKLPSEQTSVSEISVMGADIVIDGDTDFDFNQDGTLEPARLHMVLSPR